MPLRIVRPLVFSTLVLLVAPAPAATGGLLWSAGGSGEARTADGRVPGVFAPVAGPVAETAAGTYHTLIRKSDGSVWACGLNLNGQLGDGTTEEKNLPVKLATGVARIAAGDHFSLLLKTDGTLWGFGANGFGQLGLGTLVDALTPQQIVTEVKAVAAGNDHTVFVRNDGTAWGMGDNSSRQLTAASTPTTTAIQIATGVSDVAAGDTFTLLLKPDGTVWALGVAAFIPTSAVQPFKVAAGIKTMAARGGHALLLDASGTLWGMGANASGQLGDGSTSNRITPVKIANGVAACATGASHSVFLASDGSVWATGSNQNGQLGDSTSQDAKVPVRVAGRASSVAAGGYATLYVSDTGVLYQAGTNFFGEGARGTDRRLKPVLIASNVVKVVSPLYGGHMLYVTADGELWACGDNLYGELGDGTTRSRTTPIRVSTDVADAAAGQGFSLYLKRDGTLWAVGDNSYGQLGNGTTTAVPSPVQVAQKVRAVTAGAAFSAYTDANYFIWAMGNRVIPGTTTWQPITVTPKLIAGGATSISAGSQHLVASDGDTVQTMGMNDFGQLGYAPNPGYNVVSGPRDVATGTSFAAAGGNRTMYVKKDGTLWGTGQPQPWVLSSANPAGTWQQLDTHVRNASPGAEFALYVKDDNTLWGLGLVGSFVFGTDTGSDNGSNPITPGVPVKLASNVDSALAASGIAYFITLPSAAVAKPAFAAQPQSTDFNVGSLVKLAVTVSGEGPFGYQWRKNGAELPGERSASLVIPYALGADAGSYDVVVTNRGGTSVSEAAKLSFKFGTITLSPPAVTAGAPGSTTTLDVRLTSTTTVSYQWKKDGAAIAGATSSVLTFPSVAATDAGNYTLTVTNADGTMELGPYAVTVVGSRISNLSVRTDAGTEAKTLIVGFATGGPAVSKPGAILVRCIGPGLASFGVSNFIPDPIVTIADARQTIASNDNWGGGSLTATFDRVGAFRLASDSKDAAALVAAPSGIFTAKVGGGVGNALVELYDAADAQETGAARLTNVSARALLPAGGGPLMAGFVISGTGRKTILVRAIGPTLKNFGLSDALSDPKLEILKSGTAAAVASNQKWAGASSLVAAFNKVGAFALPADSSDAVLLLELEPGGYTARVTSASSSGGICLIEVYDIP